MKIKSLIYAKGAVALADPLHDHCAGKTCMHVTSIVSPGPAPAPAAPPWNENEFAPETPEIKDAPLKVNCPLILLAPPVIVTRLVFNAPTSPNMINLYRKPNWGVGNVIVRVVATTPTEGIKNIFPVSAAKWNLLM